MQTMNQQAGASVVSDFSDRGIPGMQIIKPETGKLEDTYFMFSNSSDILYVEPDHLIALSPDEEPEFLNASSLLAMSDSLVSPGDPDYSLLWGHQNTGQAPFYGTEGADISSSEAWNLTTGSFSVIIAVVDTGIEYTHEDLASNIWINPGEISDNEKDDDENGYVDDIRGWNFFNDTNDPMDDNGHGTHCAGIIGAIRNNGLGGTGVCWNTQIMPLKFLDSSGTGYTSDAISAILYANQMGAQVISCSWGGTEYSQALQEAISGSSAVIVCASGNDAANTDTIPTYPAAYPGDNIISVAATDYYDNLASFSNYGESTVDIGAPGVSILSSYAGNDYAYLSGTSMATPYVSGVAGLILAYDPSLSNTDVTSILLESAEPVSTLNGKVKSGGRLNAGTALASINITEEIPKTIEVDIPSSLQPSFVAAPRRGNAPLTVQFLDTSSGGQISWIWDFGDGSRGVVKNPRHVYPYSGSYPVALTISDGTSSNTIRQTGFIIVS